MLQSQTAKPVRVYLTSGPFAIGFILNEDLDGFRNYTNHHFNK